MSALEAASAGVKDMADGSLRITIEFEPRYAKDAFALFGAREGQGMAQRAQNWLAIPLCPSCHTGPHGFHGDRQLLKARKLDEMDLLAMTIERLNT